MAKPTAYFPVTDLPSYQEVGKGNDSNGAAFTQKADVAITATYASSGAVSIVAAASSFTNWPSYGFVENQTSGEIMLYSTKTSTTTLNVLATGRALDGTAAAAGSIGHNVRLIEAVINGRLINQILAELTNLEKVGRVVARTADLALTNAESHQVYTNEGAITQVIFTLPTAVANLEYTFIVQDVDGIRVLAAAGDTIRIAPGITNVTIAAGYIECAEIGAMIKIKAINATEWIAMCWPLGTWSVQWE